MAVQQEAGHHIVSWCDVQGHGSAPVDPEWTTDHVRAMYHAGELRSLPGAVLDRVGGLFVLLEQLGAPACPECGCRTTNSHYRVPRLCSRHWCQEGVKEMLPVRDSERPALQPYPYRLEAAA